MKATLAVMVGLAVPLPLLAQPASPYAGQQSRVIKALSPQEVAQLREGAGMGFAKAAELNRYPGPMHALEHAEALDLSAEQREALGALLARHKAEARALGARVLELEGELDQLFATGKADPASVDAVLARLAEASARLRGSHLKTHLHTTALLTPRQVERYVEVRGYGSAAPAGRHSH
jgi:Spy/CpxP family protein refolding chaperone